MLLIIITSPVIAAIFGQAVLATVAHQKRRHWMKGIVHMPNSAFRCYCLFLILPSQNVSICLCIKWYLLCKPTWPISKVITIDRLLNIINWFLFASISSSFSYLLWSHASSTLVLLYFHCGDLTCNLPRVLCPSFSLPFPLFFDYFSGHNLPAVHNHSISELSVPFKIT